MLLPHILQLTVIRNYCKTLVDSTYSNVITPNNISDNLTVTVSDHPQQFFIAPFYSIFSNPQSTKSNTSERDWSKFDLKI